MSARPFKSGSRLGKYKIQRKISEGGFATVYAARDTVEGVDVALKIPHPDLMRSENLDLFRKEARLAARLDHPGILALKNAVFIDDHFVIAFPLAEESLADRLARKVSVERALGWTEQLLEAMASAHRAAIIHCDIKPENILLFSGDRLRVGDFGIARVARHTVPASGSGTVGYMAPEQAMGKISRRSDVFSIGLVLYHLFSGKLPEWPYRPPLPGMERLRRKLSRPMIAWLVRAIDIDDDKRFRDADHMLRAFHRIRRKVRTASRPASRKSKTSGEDVRDFRLRRFKREYRKQLHASFQCPRCEGPVSEAMQGCPWCGKELKKLPGETAFPARCKRCKRGLKRDWKFCAHCYGGAVQEPDGRSYPDRRYEAKCGNCRGDLMAFQRYCPWCRHKVQKPWRIAGVKTTCSYCGWGVLRDFWEHCPWCKKSLVKRK